MGNGSKHEDAFNVFAAFPEGLTCPEFRALMETEADKRNASARLSQFVMEGLARREGAKINPESGISCGLYIPTGIPFSKRIVEKRHPNRKRRAKTEPELFALRKWKADAIKRFPELAVSERVLKARLTLADIYRKEGQSIKATLVEKGELDDTEAMRLVQAMMQ